MKMFVIILSLFMFFVINSFAQAGELATIADETAPVSSTYPDSHGSYFDWARGRDGWGHCYEWTFDHRVLNGGMPVNDQLCEASQASHAAWSRSRDGYGHCYQYTPNGIPLNQGMPIEEDRCEQVSPSHFSWGRAGNGYTYCYRFTEDGIPLNNGAPVPNPLCR